MNAPYKFTGISVPIGLDERVGISDIERSYVQLFEKMSAPLVSTATDIPNTLTALEVVIQQVIAVKSWLGGITEGAEDGGAALAYRRELHAGFDTTLLTLGLLAANLRNTSSTTMLTAPQPAVASAQPEKPKFEVGKCPGCKFLFGLYAPHDCASGENRLTIEDLNALFGSDGWFEVEVAPLGHQQPPEGTEPATPRGSEQTVPMAEVTSLGMREGSKKHRVYAATQDLLKRNGPMHIDDMMEGVSASGVFEGVKDRRARFANLLSQFKAMGLLDTDNRGNWSLPSRLGGSFR
jgi:hypothetical protein